MAVYSLYEPQVGVKHTDLDYFECPLNYGDAKKFQHRMSTTMPVRMEWNLIAGVKEVL